MYYKTKRHHKRKGKKLKGGRRNYSWARNLGKKFAKFANRKQKGGISWVSPGIVPRRYSPRHQLGYGKKSYGLAPRRSFHIHE